ncbi:MAG: cytochrome c [Pseudomonadota bacterium]
MRVLFVLLAFIGFNFAYATPFDKGDANKGKALADKQCQACHVSLFKGDGSGVYTRADRKVKTANQLAARISGCNANTGAGWFPEDELHVGAYLNNTYYKFK